MNPPFVHLCKCTLNINYISHSVSYKQNAQIYIIAFLTYKAHQEDWDNISPRVLDDSNYWSLVLGIAVLRR